MRLRFLLLATVLVASCGDDGTKPLRIDGSLPPVGDGPPAMTMDGGQADVPAVQPDGGAPDMGPSATEVGSPSSSALERPPGELPRPPLSGLPAEL